VGSGAGGMSDVAARFRRSKLEPRMISRHGDVGHGQDNDAAGIPAEQKRGCVLRICKSGASSARNNLY
jgi:hypothetical protein